MTRKLTLFLLIGCVPVLAGCVAGVAANAVGAAVRGAQPRPSSNGHLKPTAAAACSAHASHYGTVRVIDVEQRTASKIIVWGTVDDGKQRQSFECAFGTNIAGFKLRAIAPAR